MKSKFYRLYVNGSRHNMLIVADNICDALHLAGCEADETAEFVRVVHVDEKEITVGEIRGSTIISYTDQKED